MAVSESAYKDVTSEEDMTSPQEDSPYSEENESLVESALSDMLSPDMTENNSSLANKEVAVKDVLSDMLSEETKSDSPQEDGTVLTVSESDKFSDGETKSDPDGESEVSQTSEDESNTALSEEIDESAVLADDSSENDVQTSSETIYDDEGIPSDSESVTAIQNETDLPVARLDDSLEEVKEDTVTISKHIDVAEIKDAIKKGKNIDEMLNDDLDLESLLFRSQEDEHDDETVDQVPANDDAELISFEQNTDETETFDPDTAPVVQNHDVEMVESDLSTDKTGVEEQSYAESSDISSEETEYEQNEASSIDESPSDDIVTPQNQVVAELDSVDVTDSAENNSGEDSDIQNNESSSEEFLVEEDSQTADNDNIGVPSEKDYLNNNTEDDIADTVSETEELAAENDNEVSEQDDIKSDSDESFVLENEKNDASVSVLEPSPEEDLSEQNISEPFNWKIPDQEGYDITGNDGVDDETVFAGGEENESKEDFINHDSFVDIDDSRTSSDSAGYTDNAILNMLHHGPADNIIKPEESASGDLSDDDLISMLNNSSTENDLENDYAEVDRLPSSSLNDESESLSPKQHQYLVDELNLARLYFETGDTDEALKMVDEIINQGSGDLIEKAHELRAEYGY